MTTKTWEERLTFEQKEQVERELKEFGLEPNQIRSLMKFRGRATELELTLMRDLPPNCWGKRATINVVKDAIRTGQYLGLITVEKQKPSLKKGA